MEQGTESLASSSPFFKVLAELYDEPCHTATAEAAYCCCLLPCFITFVESIVSPPPVLCYMMQPLIRHSLIPHGPRLAFPLPYGVQWVFLIYTLPMDSTISVGCYTFHADWV